MGKWVSDWYFSDLRLAHLWVDFRFIFNVFWKLVSSCWGWQKLLETSNTLCIRVRVCLCLRPKASAVPTKPYTSSIESSLKQWQVEKQASPYKANCLHRTHRKPVRESWHGQTQKEHFFWICLSVIWKHTVKKKLEARRIFFCICIIVYCTCIAKTRYGWSWTVRSQTHHIQAQMQNSDI